MTEIRPAFLLSLPRSGSTLLQRLLGAHRHVTTVAEPWFLLPPLYALRPHGAYTEYGHRTTARAIEGLCGNLPGGRADYLAAVAAMATQLYDRLSPAGTRVFLDKTPRYGLVVDELLAAFPDATFILLHRNPLAVVASITASFTGSRWKPHHHKQDLYLLPSRLLDAQQRHPDAFEVVRYEDVVAQPRATVGRLVTALGLEWEEEVLEAFAGVSVAGAVGDPTGVRAYDRVSTEPLAKWQAELASPVRQAWARRYLRWLGAERLALMGYDLDELLEALATIPKTYREVVADVADTAKGVVWSLAEAEISRSKLRSLPRWREIFTHT